MNQQRQYIENITNRRITSDENTLDDLSGAIDRLQKTFPRYGSFLMEFVQNADDEGSISLKIEILENTIKISNTGNPFKEENVKSICKVGRSSKTPENYIGYLGVGFKSVFLISECPEIYSGNFRFKFDKNAWDDPGHTPWQVMPLWIDEQQLEFSGKYKTIFNLPLKEIKLIDKISEEVTQAHLNNRILLFLRNIKEIEIIDSNQDFKRKIIKSSNISKTPGYEIYQMQEYENDTLKSQDNWLIIRSVCETPDDVKEDYVTKEWDREKVEHREVLVAFKLDEENNLIKEEKGTAHIGVFSFLPIKELKSGLNFLIQSDFLTTPGRGELARECLWNNWLADEIYKLIIEKCIPTFLTHEQWKMNFTEVLYSYEGGHELFDYYIKRPLKEYLENNAVLIAEDGSLIKPENAISSDIEEDIKDLHITESDLETLYPGKKVLHSKCSAPWEIKTRVENEPRFNANKGLVYKMEKLLDIKAKEKNIGFFKNFYRKHLLTYKKSGSSTLYRLRKHDILLTEDWTLTDANSLYINSKNLIISPEVKENFKIVHLDLITEPDILAFLKILGTTELTEEDIQNILRTKEIPEISRNWENLSEEEKIRETKIFKELCEKHKVDARNLGFLTLKSKDGKWDKPENSVFSKEYKPDHRIEELTEESLLNSKDLQRLNIKFLSNEYIAGDNEEIQSWRDFFKNLGLEQNLDKKNVVQRIGINKALCFENEYKKRNAIELTRSEESKGYDIESNSGERLIEVKSRSDPSPTIFLTPAQHKKLQEEEERYFIYVVRDALRNPVLSEIKGTKILDVDYSISVNFDTWKNLSEEEFQ